MKFSDITNMSGEETFSNLYSRYIDYRGYPGGDYYKGFFYHNNRIVMIYHDIGYYNVTLVSHNDHASLHEIQELINGILYRKHF